MIFQILLIDCVSTIIIGVIFKYEYMLFTSKNKCLEPEEYDIARPIDQVVSKSDYAFCFV